MIITETAITVNITKATTTTTNRKRIKILLLFDVKRLMLIYLIMHQSASNEIISIDL